MIFNPVLVTLNVMAIFNLFTSLSKLNKKLLFKKTSNICNANIITIPI